VRSADAAHDHGYEGPRADRAALQLRIPAVAESSLMILACLLTWTDTYGFGAWRTIQGFIDFVLVHSYLDTATKWGIDKLDALRQLLTTGPWLPPALTPAE